MAKDRSVYLGPRLKRLRRELGLTQNDMAADLDVSPSYIALMERNQRPVTADLLLRVARTYRIDMADLASATSDDTAQRMQAALRDPMFAGIDLPALEIADAAVNYPGVSEALLRLYTAYREEQLALADRIAGDEPDAGGASDPVAEVRAFLTARRNAFPLLDDAAELLVAEAEAAGGTSAYLKARFGLKLRRLPPDVMMGALRRYDRHRSELLLDETLDTASQRFQIALQLAYLAMRRDIDACLADGQFSGEAGRQLARRALASYAAAAIIMPHAAFAGAAEARAYDLEALARQFGASFEQVAHRLTTLQRPGSAAGGQPVPFFFIRIDQAGNISKRLDGAGFPFARHGGACPLWSLHRAFLTPRQIVTQWLELPDGQRFFSIARTVTAGGGAFGAPRVERAIALGCSAEHAQRLVYVMADARPPEPTPIGISCRLCQRTECQARSAPPIGRELLADDYRRTATPFALGD
jgi:XRE family transcriptional regulator, fatty acid utilization regulator